MTGPDRTTPEPGPDASVQDIQADIEHTREQLGQTVSALSDKLDVKARSKQKVAETQQRLAVKAGETKELIRDKPVPVVAVAAAIAIVVVIWRRRRAQQ